MFLVDTIFNTNTNKFNKISEYIRRNSHDHFSKLSGMLINFDINTCDKDGKNLLHIFSNITNVALLQSILLTHGCNINQRDNFGKTPIFYASSTYLPIFIKHGADLSIRDNENHSVLYYKSEGFYYESISPLIADGIMIDYSEYEPREVLHKAVMFRDMEKMKQLIDFNNFMINAGVPDKIFKCEIPITPLYVACKNELYDEFIYLIESGADPKEPLLLIRLMQAYYNKVLPDFIKMIKRLLELGASVSDIIKIPENNTGETILHNCYKSAELMELFLKYGADIHKRTNHNKVDFYKKEQMIRNDAEPLLYLTNLTVDKSIYEVLFNYGADPNVQNSHGINAFMGICCSWFLGFISEEDRCDIIQLFLDKGVDIYARDIYGGTVFDYICENYQLTTTKKANIIKIIHKHEKFIILRPKTNEFIYNLLNNCNGFKNI